MADRYLPGFDCPEKCFKRIIANDQLNYICNAWTKAGKHIVCNDEKNFPEDCPAKLAPEIDFAAEAEKMFYGVDLGIGGDKAFRKYHPILERLLRDFARRARGE